MAATKLLNPRGYLSWTQINLWLQNPETYIRRYIHGDAGFTNSGMQFGSKVSKALEGGVEEADGAMEALVSLLPRYDTPELEIRVPLKTPKGSVDLLGRMDTFRAKPLGFREYKTGRVKWTQAKAERHKQMPHYGTLIYLKHGGIPEAWLDWAETEEVEGEVRLTGRIESFHVNLSMAAVLQYMALASRVAQEIDAAYRAELKKMA